MAVVALRGEIKLLRTSARALYFQGEDHSSEGAKLSRGPNGGPPTGLPIAFSKIA
jgi:hypothetical protein